MCEERKTMARSKQKLTAQDILYYLDLYGKELEQRGYPAKAHLLLIGGAYMITHLGVLRTTEDIDVYPLDQTWPERAPEPLPIMMDRVTKDIAKLCGLDEQWFQTSRKSAMQVAGGIPQGTYWRTFGALEIYLPPRDYILFLKLRINRPKDSDDIDHLCQLLNIHTRAQAQVLVDHYMPDPSHQAVFRVADILARRFSA
jgi:hypothetical protein